MLRFLQGGGEMGSIIRAFDWASHPLGPPQHWAQPLRLALRIMLTTNHPIFVFWGSEHYCFYNDAYRRSIGPERHPGALGMPGRQVWDEIWDIIGPQIELVMAGKGATWHEDHLVPITRFGRREEVYWTYSYSPIDDLRQPSGVGGILVICTETTQNVLSLRRQELLLHELSHRIKNLLSVVQALSAHSAQRASSATEAHEIFRERLMALSRAQDLLTGKDWNSSELTQVVRAAVHHAEHVGDRLEISGPEIRLRPQAVLALTLALHELSTNAVKYGALRSPTGRISVTWEKQGEAGDQVRMRWKETGGPPVVPPTQTGFGSRLIERTVTSELGGNARLLYAPDGIECTIQFNLSKTNPV